MLKPHLLQKCYGHLRAKSQTETTDFCDTFFWSHFV